MVIGFAFNVVRTVPGSDPQMQEDIEFDSPYAINQIKNTLEEMGNEVILIEANEDAYDILKANKERIDIVFVIAQGKYGDTRESQIPLFCELLKIPYTHSSPTTHAIGLDKTFTKMILKGEGIRVPNSHVIRTPESELGFGLKYPIIVKPNKEGSSKGIYNRNVVTDAQALEERIRFMSDNFATEVIIEEYIEGREFVVLLLGNKPPRILPIIEQKFDFLPPDYFKFNSFESRWSHQGKLPDISGTYKCPAEITPELQKDMISTSLKVFDYLEVKDCANIDYRVSTTGELFFIEINTLPALNPDEKVISYLPISAKVAGIDYKTLIKEILYSALKRYGMLPSNY